MSVWARIMARDTKWRAVDENLAEGVVFNCAIFIVASCVLHPVLRLCFSTLVGDSVLDSYEEQEF